MSIDLTLDRIRALKPFLPPYTRPTCHIAGTNGKGSVASLLSSVLTSSSLSVGRFNSPHLVSIYDCITIDNKPVDSGLYYSTRALVQDADEKAKKIGGEGASSFELLTMTALLVFESLKLDIVVIEVGMGGRLDATNVIEDEYILVSALTAVDLDHQAFLGNTVADIAREKAGIARKGRPFVMGPQKYAEVVSSVEKQVDGADFVRDIAQVTVTPMDHVEPRQFSFSPSDISAFLTRRLRITLRKDGDSFYANLPLYGEHQIDNLRLACSIISTLITQSSDSSSLPSSLGESCRQLLSRLHKEGSITPGTIARGIESVQWRGRLSFHTVAIPEMRPDRRLTVLVDGAHNPASSMTLSSFIQTLLGLCGQRYKKLSLTYILALSHSPPKTPVQTLAPIFSTSIINQDHPSGLQVKVNVALVTFTPPEGMPWVKSVPPAELRQAVLELAPGVATWVPADVDGSNEGQLSRALAWASTKYDENAGEDSEGLVVLAGSLYLVADLYRFLDLQ